MDNKIIQELKEIEKEKIVEVMAFMSYNPSIGRVLEKGGVKKFQKMAVAQMKTLIELIDNEEIMNDDYLKFDTFHNNWVKEFKRKIKTHSAKRCSYGQAQKAINVFLKVYFDWAGLPKRRISKKILRHLHVPLDVILMKQVKSIYSDEHKKTFTKKQRSNYGCSLSKIKKNEYDRWQKLFRKKHRSKPLLFDIIWAMYR